MKNIRKSLESTSDLDLILVLAVSGAAIVLTFTPVVNDTAMRSIIALPFLLFIPGYSFNAALFPGARDVEGLTRCALSLGISLALIPIVGFGLNYTTWGIRVESFAFCTAVITIVGTSIAYRRRHALPEEQRFSVSVKKATPLKKRLFPESESRFDRNLTVIVIVVALLSIPTLAYLITSSKPTEAYTALSITPVDGKLAEYPTDFQLGQQKAVTVSVANHEGSDQTYKLVTTFGNGTNTQTLDSQVITVATNQVWKKNIDLRPDAVGTHMKIAFLLYEDNASIPYRDVYLWVNVTTPS